MLKYHDHVKRFPSDNLVRSLIHIVILYNSCGSLMKHKINANHKKMKNIDHRYVKERKDSVYKYKEQPNPFIRR